MSNGAEERLSALDRVLDDALRLEPSLGESLVDRVRGVIPGLDSPPEQSLADDLFGVVDVLNSSVSLRRALTDPSTPPEGRSTLARSLLEHRLSRPAVFLVAEAAAMRWSGGRTFVAAIERQAIRAELSAAEAAGQLEETEDALFRFGRLVESAPDLRNALSDRSIGVAERQGLVENLLAGRATPSTITLAKRAVRAEKRTFGLTLESYVTMAATHKNRIVATVRVAQPLSPELSQRLQAALSRQVGRAVVIQVIIDQSVLGGVRVELGDEIFEGTVADRLDDARRHFS